MRDDRTAGKPVQQIRLALHIVGELHGRHLPNQLCVLAHTLKQLTARHKVTDPRKNDEADQKERQQYNKLVRDVKRTLPYARLIYETLIETYEYIETLPDEKSKQAHLKRMEKELYAQYKPELKKLTLSQGKLLIKLVDRECHQSSYNLAKAYLGSFRAGFWNIFAGMFGASLKTKYDPNGKDALTERVVLLVQCGAI